MAETKKTTTEAKEKVAKKPAAKKSTSTSTTKKTSTTTKAAAPKKAPAKKAEVKKEVAPKATVAKKSAPKKAEAKDLTKDAKLNFDVKKLPTELFASEKIYSQAVFDTIMSERASRRQGTHSVKSRAEVRGGGKKPWRQKGTGRARAGSTRSPIWVGGGRAFGPTPERNYTLKVNKKAKKAAFVSALTLLANNNAVVVDNFELKEVKTKAAVEKLTNLGVYNLKHVLIVTNDDKVAVATNNLQNVICVRANSVLVEQLIWADVLVLSEEALEVFKVRGEK